jgi:class 3 adenylate cyclase
MGAAGSPNTLTFLFADLESSTRLWETLPAAMRDALERDAILNDADVSICAMAAYDYPPR